MNKSETINTALDGRGCLGESDADEPVFVLCARDPIASAIVREWADLYEVRKVSCGAYTNRNRAKVAEARDLANQMDEWRREKAERDKAEQARARAPRS